MPESIYRQSLKHAWQLTWRNKPLWILGLLSVFLGEFGLNNFAGQILKQPNLPDIKLILSYFYITDIRTAVGLVWILLFIFGFGILIFLAASIAEGSLIFAIAHWYKKNNLPSPNQTWKKGVVSFWNVLLINLIRKILLVLIILAAWSIWFIIAPIGGSVAWWLFFLLTFIEILIAFTLSSIAIFCLCYAVVGGNNLWQAIKRGILLFKEHILVSLELSIVLFFCNIILLLILLVAAIFAFIPAFFLWLIAAATGHASLILVGFAVGWTLLILFAVMAGAVFNTFSTSAWVYFFMKMHHEGIFSRIIHHVKKIFLK